MAYKIIGVIGDSISNGYWDEEGKGGWFNRMFERIAREYPLQYGADNMASDGDRIPDAYHRFISEGLSRELDTLLIAVGGNGAIRSPEPDSPLDLSAHLRDEYWRRMLNLAKKSGIKTVVMDILPVREDLYPEKGWFDVPYYQSNDDIEAYNLQLQGICTEIGIPFFERFPLWDARDLSALYKDARHPNAAGHQMLADETFAFLKKSKILP